MKKRTLLALLLVAALFLGAVSAAGGDAADPLVSLDYLNNVFAPAAERAADDRLDAADAALYGAAGGAWRAAVTAAETVAGSEYTPVWTEDRLKEGDTLSGLTGLQVLVLAGDARVQFASGAVVDVTAGAEVASGGALLPNHRYLVAEDTTAVFTVASKTAVVDYCGRYRFARSAQPDRNAMAAALKALTLLRGTYTGYGEGYDLEQVPTRIQALIMLIRLLGEEQAALATAAAHPFADVPEWCAPYVAYAYEKGYSNGVSATEFAPNSPASAMMYVEFILRALGYSSTAQTDISDALIRAYEGGVLTLGEWALLEDSVFLRADIAYLSYYALEVPLSGDTRLLHEKLEQAGVFSAESYAAARQRVVTERL